MIYTTKKELAQAYCPNIDYTAALKKLNVYSNLKVYHPNHRLT